MPEITLEEYELMNRILSDTRTGWWKADYRLQTYFFSKQIMELTGLPSDRLSFADFLNRIRTDFRFRIGEEIATLEQPYVYDMTFPILCPKGEIWIHIKKLHQEKNAHGDSIITGSIQIVDSPETTKSEQAAALRINNLLYQLNNISYTLLSFLQNNNKIIYVSLLVILSFFLFLDYIPGMHAYSAWVTPPVALFLGLSFALLCGQAHPKFNKKISKYLLQYSVVGLGFGMNLQASLASGKEGMEFTVISVVGTLLIGWGFGRKFLKVDRDTSYLISSGTAICGGSAIAAVGPVLRAKDSEMSVALGTIFILNAIALFIFPVIGHALNMSQHEFGTWAAIAIHDTSSVVGAGAAYGEEALRVATTIKLTRALWIIPLAIATSFIFKSKGQKISIPWFIFFFVLAMIVNTYVLNLSETGALIGAGINSIARKALTITLFFIGASLSRDVLKAVGIKPLVQGILLWVVISVSTLAYIYWS